jgi:hypothetical protein
MRALIFSFCFLIASSNCFATVETLKSAADKAIQAAELARKGEYGRLSTTQINMVLESRNRIERLAKENSSFEDFDAKEQRIFDSARERINRLTQRSNSARVICKRVVKTGTRLIENECLSVAQREARAKASRERTDQIQRAACNNNVIACSGGG